MAPSNTQPKMMSSALAGMKFMQRAAALQPSTPSKPTEPASKKQRLSVGSNNTMSPATPLSAFGDAEEQRRALAAEREGSLRGESKWYLSFKEPQTAVKDSPQRIVSAGFSALDADGPRRDTEGEGIEEPRLGRRSFGKFNIVLEKQQNPGLSSSHSESEDSASENDIKNEEKEDDPTGVGAMITEARRGAAAKARTDHRAKKAAGKTDALRLAGERRKRLVKLNESDGLKGISSNSGLGSSSASKNVECYCCGKRGHIKSECPEGDSKQQQQQQGGKKRKSY